MSGGEGKGEQTEGKRGRCKSCPGRVHQAHKPRAPHLRRVELAKLLAELLLLRGVDRAVARARRVAATTHDALGHVHSSARSLLHHLLPPAALGTVVILARVGAALAVMTLAAGLGGA